MCVVIIMNEKYCNPDDLSNVVAYAVKEAHCQCGFYGATGMKVGSVEEMTAAMRTVKQEFQKTGGRQLFHIVISFNDKKEGWITPEIGYRIGYEFSARFFEGYQVVFGVHDNTDNLHLHLVVNSVSYRNGLKYGIPKNGQYVMMDEIQNLVQKYSQKEQTALL